MADAYVYGTIPDKTSMYTKPDFFSEIMDFRCVIGDFRNRSDSIWTFWLFETNQKAVVDGRTIDSQRMGKDSAMTGYATCDAKGHLTVSHYFATKDENPIEGTRIEVEVVDNTNQPVREGKPGFGKMISYTNAEGDAKFITGVPHARCKVNIIPTVTDEQINDLYDAYQEIVKNLTHMLMKEWWGNKPGIETTVEKLFAQTQTFTVGKQKDANEIANHIQQLLDNNLSIKQDFDRFESDPDAMGFSFKWNNYLQLSPEEKAAANRRALLAGAGKVFVDLGETIADLVKGIWNFLGDLSNNIEKIKNYIDGISLEQIKASIDKILLILGDKAFIYIMVSLFMTWYSLLPIEDEQFLSSNIFFEIIIGVLLAWAIRASGIMVKAGQVASTSLASLGASASAVLRRLIEWIMIAATITITKLKPSKYISALKHVLPNEKPHLNSKGLMRIESSPEYPKVNQAPNEPSKIKNEQSKGNDGKPQQPIGCTKTSGCPVSMVTGEELLTLTDGMLSGLLPFEWQRNYRTSAAEIDIGMGYGWSHPLNHQLEIENDQICWINDQNTIIILPLPTKELSDGANYLAEAAIYLGKDENEYILAKSEGKGYYHFRKTKSGAQLEAITDQYNNRISIHRDISGRIKRLHNNAGYGLLIRYENSHIVGIDFQKEIPAETEALSWKTIQTMVSYEYNKHNQLIKSTTPQGFTEAYQYDELNVIQERCTPSGAKFYWTWENTGKHSRCIHHWSNFGQDMHYQWDDAGTVEITYEDGSKELYSHDTETAKLLKHITPSGGETAKEYDEQGHLIYEKSPTGAETIYEYDGSQLRQMILPEQEPIHYYYKNGFVYLTKQGQTTWYYKRNEVGDILEQTDPLGHKTRYEYTTTGKIKAIHYADGSKHLFNWNKLGQLIEETTPEGELKRYRYDALGHQIIRQDGAGKTTQLEYDDADRLIKIIFPNQTQRTYQYNHYNKVTQVTDEEGRITRYEYTPFIETISRKINPDGTSVNYKYDSKLNLTEIINEQNQHYYLSYTPNGLVQQEIDFDGRKTSYQYDQADNLISKTEYDQQGNTCTTLFDRSLTGKLTRKQLPDGKIFNAEYDEQGHLVALDDGQWPINFEYDEAGKLIAEHQGWATLRYQYNVMGQLKQCTLPDGNVIHYQYHKGKQLAQINLNDQPLTTHHYAFGQEVERQQGNITTQYDYDEQGQLKAQFISRHQTTLIQRKYQYNRKGNLVGIADNRKGTRQFQYDPLDRLVAIRGDITENLIHDPAGNLLSQSNTFSQVESKGSKLLMQGDRHFSYDDFGNLIQERRGQGQKLVTHYQYDSLHKLSQVTLPDGSQANYSYDAYGRRIRKIITTKTGEKTKTEYIWLGDNLIAEKSKHHYQTYLYEPKTHKPLALLKGKGKKAEIYYYHLDHLGTPQELTSAHGHLAWSARYKAYGSLAVVEVNEVEQPLRFQGQYHDLETGLYYNNNRYYDPSLGRYTTPDPIKLAGGLNSYRYTNNPINEIDPLGLVVCPRSKIVATDPATGAKFLDDIDEHLVSGHGVNMDHTKRNGGISGTHNMDNFEKIATDNDFQITKKQISPGIYEVTYAKKSKIGAGKEAGTYIVDEKGAVKTQPFKNPKTVYDPKVYSDDQIKEWGKKAAFRGYNDAKKQAEAIRIESSTANNFRYIEKEGDVTFEVWINFDKNLSDWVISSYYPIK